MGSVLEHDPEILEKKAIAEGRFNTDIGGDADEDEVADPPRTQHAVELGMKEAGISRLVQHDVAGVRLEVRDELIIPLTARQELALKLWSRAHGLEGVGLVIVGRTWPAGLDIIRVPAILEIDHRHTRPSRRFQNRLGVGDDFRGAGNVEAGQIKISALRGVGVLHVDDDHRRL